MLWEPDVAAEPLDGGLCFTVLGDAQPAGSKRAFTPKGWDRPIVVDDNPKTKPWQQQVAGEAMEALAGRAAPLFPEGPLAVEITFFRSRPRGHYGSGGNAGRVRASAPSAPSTRPDVLKLARGVEDAMSSIVYRDDAQIVDERLRKVWGDPARVEIVVRAL